MARRKFEVKPYRHRPSTPYRVVGPEMPGLKRTVFFKTKEEAEDECLRRNKALQRHGLEAFALPDAVRVEVGRCLELLAPHSATLSDAVLHYVAHLKTGRRGVTFNQVCTELVEALRVGHRSHKTLVNVKHRAGHFAADGFGARPIGSITTAEIDAWLARTSGATTRNGHRRVLNRVFSFAISRDYLPLNPVARTMKARERRRDPGILTPEETGRLLAACVPEILPYAVLAVFMGVRPEELWSQYPQEPTVRWGDFRWRQGFLRIREEVAKTGPKRNVTINPAAAAWLEPYRERADGPLCPRNLRRLWKQARQSAGLLETWESDCLRHTFATYHHARDHNFGQLASEMGNSEGVIRARYLKTLDAPEDAIRFWGQRPGVF